MRYKFAILVLFGIVIFYRPLCSILLLLLLYTEYYNAMYFLFLIKNTDFYIKINMLKPEVSSMNNVDMWFIYCKINAFLRIYFFLSKKKKIKLFSLLVISIVYVFHIPLRLLKLTYYFVLSKKDFRTSLIFLVLDSYALVQNLQIEVLNGKVYLNCNNVSKLTNLILNSNKLLNKTSFCRGMINLQKISKNFSDKEESYGKCEVDLCIIKNTDGNVLSKIPHYTVVENKTSLHATSNIRQVFLNNQRVDGIIPTLVKQGAIQPGTVVTKGIAGIKIIPNKSVWVPNSEIDIIKANHIEFVIDENIRNYQIEKEETFRETLIENFKLDKNINSDLLRGLRYNEFTRDLNAANIDSFNDEYVRLYKFILNSDDKNEF